jgi:hypothetical protein
MSHESHFFPRGPSSSVSLALFSGIGFTGKASVASRLWSIKDRCILHSSGSWNFVQLGSDVLDVASERKRVRSVFENIVPESSGS